MSDRAVGLIGIFVILAGALCACTSSHSEEERQYGVHCMNGWTGSHLDFEEKVKASLRDPKSFEHVETRTSKVVNGQNKVRMEFRAKNGFGGINRAFAYGVIDNKTCKLISWRISE